MLPDVDARQMSMPAVSSTLTFIARKTDQSAELPISRIGRLGCPGPPALLARQSRAKDSIVGQFCRKNVLASSTLGARTLTLQACLPPSFVIWK